MLTYFKQEAQDSWLYWLSVTFKFIQGQWFSFHLKGCMPLPVSD